MSEDKKIVINTQGGAVINGGTFTNVEFVAYKYVVNESPKMGFDSQTEVVETIETEAVETDNSLDLIFHDALDMAKVKVALGDVLIRKDKSGKQIFGQKNLVYVVYKFFMENDWFEKDNQAKFREWMAANYGEAFQCKKSHFDGVNEMCKRNALASWKPTWTPYITAANALNERFKGDNNPEWEKNFLKPNRYIAHNFKTK